MSYIASVIKSINYYSGTIAVASGFSGDKTVTISSVDPNKAVILPVGGNVSSSAQGFYKAFGQTSNSNCAYAYVQVTAATTVSFKSVTNSDPGSVNIVYSFVIVEFK